MPLLCRCSSKINSFDHLMNFEVRSTILLCNFSDNRSSIKSLFLLSKSWNNKWKNRKWILMLGWNHILRTFAYCSKPPIFVKKFNLKRIVILIFWTQIIKKYWIEIERISDVLLEICQNLIFFFQSFVNPVNPILAWKFKFFRV